MEPESDDVRKLAPGTIQYKWQVITYSSVNQDDKCSLLLESKWFNKKSDCLLNYEEDMISSIVFLQKK